MGRRWNRGVRALWRTCAALAAGRGARRALWLALCVAAMAALFASVGLPQDVDLRAGQVAPFTIKALHDFVDRPATLAAQNAAAARVRPVYAVDPSVTQDALARFDAAVQQLVAGRRALTPSARAPAATGTGGASAVATGGGAAAGGSSAGGSTAAPAGTSGAAANSGTAAGGSVSVGTTAGGTAGTAPAPARAAAAARGVAQEAARLRGTLRLGLPAADFEAALQARPAAFDALASAARATLQATLARGVRQGDVAAVRRALAERVAALPGPRGAARLFAALDASLVVPDDFLDGPATDAAEAEARAAVVPVVIAAGQVIVREGDRVTAADITRLRDAGLLHPGGPYGVLATSLLIAAGLAGLSWAFLARVHRRTLADEVELLLFTSVFCAAAAAVRFSAPLSPFLAPVSWAAMLATVAFGSATAVFVGALGGLTAGLLDHNLAVALTATASAWTAVFAMRRLQQRSDLLRAGLFAALGGATAVLLVGLFVGQDPAAGSALLGDGTVGLWRAMAAAGVSGLFSGMLAVGTLPYLEFLGVLTPFRLMELSDPAQPLLRRLMLEAPGTYHHSLMVANLAEAACQAIGADALLARAGAYYHDVGKVRRPYFFIENQFGGENPHDRLSPQLSALVVLSHVRDGVELARQAHLPAAVVDFIRTHHGTTLVGFFFRRAQERAAAAVAAGDARGGHRGGGPAPPAGAGAMERIARGDDALAGVPDGVAVAGAAGVEEDAFRYSGPLPATREQAVVMLADTVEAAVRACGRPSAEDIHATVDRLVAARLGEGQLDRADLTLRDLDLIKGTFRRILAGVYHARIEYPPRLEEAARAAPAEPGAVPRAVRRLPWPGAEPGGGLPR